jgi:acetolactate synthase-1/2/3 large subunit
MKYSDQIAEWLLELGYTHCFFVAGGNIMHLLESVRQRFTCVSFGHEVAAGIAAEYFNEVSGEERAFALVTAGPGLTNIITSLAGAYLEYRELLVIGGQVKVSDLSRGTVRQRGIQEVDGVAIARPVTVVSRLLDEVIGRDDFVALVQSGTTGAKGPVFIEIPLDIQARDYGTAAGEAATWTAPPSRSIAGPSEEALAQLAEAIRTAERPVLLLGGSVSRAAAARAHPQFDAMGLPIMTTWTGADRIGSDNPYYFGRPNIWGQRYANILIQQSDLVVGLGTRLGFRLTGFNWQEYAPLGKVAQFMAIKPSFPRGILTWTMRCLAALIVLSNIYRPAIWALTSRGSPSAGRSKRPSR